MAHSFFVQPVSAEVTFLLISMAGFVVGKFFHKIKLPDITGQVFLGLIIEPSGYLILDTLFGTGHLVVFSEHDLHGITFFFQ